MGVDDVVVQCGAAIHALVAARDYPRALKDAEWLQGYLRSRNGMEREREAVDDLVAYLRLAPEPVALPLPLPAKQPAAAPRATMTVRAWLLLAFMMLLLGIGGTPMVLNGFDRAMYEGRGRKALDALDRVIASTRNGVDQRTYTTMLMEARPHVIDFMYYRHSMNHQFDRSFQLIAVSFRQMEQALEAWQELTRYRQVRHSTLQLGVECRERDEYPVPTLWSAASKNLELARSYLEKGE